MKRLEIALNLTITRGSLFGVIRWMGAGSPKYLTLTNNPKNPPPPHEKIKNYIEFNDKTRMVVRDYSLGGGGLSRLFVMWQELLANPPLQIVGFMINLSRGYFDYLI